MTRHQVMLAILAATFWVFVGAYYAFPERQAVVFGLGLYALFATLYLVPTILVLWRRHPQSPAIIALNIVAGWTFIGWVAALVWGLIKSADRAPRGQTP